MLMGSIWLVDTWAWLGLDLASSTYRTYSCDSNVPA